jgi:glycosyltransferase involved in cell wall biosynthesis
MKVLYVINSMSMGGAERQLANLLRPLADLGVESYLATLTSDETNLERAKPFLVRYEPALLKRRWPAALPRLVRLAREVDVVHTHLPWSDIPGRVAALAARKPVVSTFHSTWYDPSHLRALPVMGRHKVQLIRALDGFSVRWTRALFAPSDTVREVYSRALRIPPERITIIHNGIDLREFAPSQFVERGLVRAGFGISSEELAISVVARFYPPKDHSTVIAAVGALAKELPVHLYLAGSGPLEERLRGMARKCDAPVTFLGPRQDVPRLLFASDLFVLPTFYEAYSLALMEAMAMGLPCLASDIPENREVGGDAIAYAPPGDVTALTCQLRGLLCDPILRASLGRQARTRAENFDVGIAAARLFEAYRSVLD